jgi:hypothetical protein
MGWTEVLCLSAQDVILLYTCPLIACIGSVLRAWIGEINLRQLPSFKRIPVDEPDQKLKQTTESWFERTMAVMGIAFAGSAIGFGVACMFIGAIQPMPSAIGRVWMLALIFGFSLPILAERFDQRMTKIVDARLGS